MQVDPSFAESLLFQEDIKHMDGSPFLGDLEDSGSQEVLHLKLQSIFCTTYLRSFLPWGTSSQARHSGSVEGHVLTIQIHLKAGSHLHVLK